MPFLPPNQQCQSTEGSGRPTKSQSHNSIALSCPAKIHTFHKSSTLKSASDVHRLAARLNSFYPRDAMLALVLAMALCLSVCLSQVGIPLEWLEGSRWFLAWGLHSTSHTLCFKEILLYTKINALPSGTFSETLDGENFATAHHTMATEPPWQNTMPP